MGSQRDDDKKKLFQKKNCGSRHQRLFKENVSKTKKGEKWSTI